MKSFTYGSREALDALVEKITTDPDHYPIRFNTSDMIAFVTALHTLYSEATPDPDLAYWAGDFLSGIATTYDIEMI